LRSYALALGTLLLASAACARSDQRSTQIITGLEQTYYVAGAPRAPQTLAERMGYYRVPGVSIAVIDDYRVTWVYAAGFADVASRAPVSTSTLFQAASMSKPVAAAGILRLFEEKGLSLDADVNALLRTWHVPPPPFKTSEHVTMRRLLSHNAGINVHGFVGYDRDAPLPTLVQVLEGAPPANSPAIRETAVPGSTTEYSGGGTTIAQQVAVDLTGQPFPDFMRETLLGPLRMTNSTFEQPLPQRLWPRAADGYYGDGMPVHRGWHVYPTMAAAGLWTTPGDLAAFVIAIENALRGRGKPPIDATVASEMTTKASDSFGLGPELQPGYFTHNGANEGFRGVFVGLTTGGRGVVVLTNSDNGLALTDEVVHSVAKAYTWPVLQPQPKTAIALSSAAMRAVAGAYAAPFSGETVTLYVTIGRAGGEQALFLRTSLDAFQSRLYAESPLNLFTLNGASLAFGHGNRGRVTSLLISGVKFERVP
jgi:CubicO group peptidase (beta-lactamase class C family)